MKELDESWQIEAEKFIVEDMEDYSYEAFILALKLYRNSLLKKLNEDKNRLISPNLTKEEIFDNIIYEIVNLKYKN